MPLVGLGPLLKAARNSQTAVGAFNIFNPDGVLAVVKAAELAGAPVVIALSESHLKYCGLDTLSTVMRLVADRSNVPISLQFDHGKSLEAIRAAIEHGFGSVMYDGYGLPFVEKVHHTREVVKFAHDHGVLVEAPLGRMPSAADKCGKPRYEHDGLTDPSLVEEFVGETGIDILAVVVGTVHGLRAGEATLDLERLARVKATCRCFLSLHGGSGVPDAAYADAIKSGINKISIFTRLSTAAVARIRRTLEESEAPPRFPDLIAAASEGVTETVARLIDLFGSKCISLY